MYLFEVPVFQSAVLISPVRQSSHITVSANAPAHNNFSLTVFFLFCFQLILTFFVTFDQTEFILDCRQDLLGC